MGFAIAEIKGGSNLWHRKRFVEAILFSTLLNFEFHLILTSAFVYAIEKAEGVWSLKLSLRSCFDLRTRA